MDASAAPFEPLDAGDGFLDTDEPLRVAEQTAHDARAARLAAFYSDTETESEGSTDDDDGRRTQCVDAEAREDVASRVRTGLLLHLSLFGLLGLAAHAGRLYSAEAPFLGASGAIICGHNVLVCARKAG